MEKITYKFDNHEISLYIRNRYIYSCTKKTGVIDTEKVAVIDNKNKFVLVRTSCSDHSTIINNYIYAVAKDLGYEVLKK